MNPTMMTGLQAIAEIQVVSVPAFPRYGHPKWIPKGVVHFAEDAGPFDGVRKVRIVVIDDESLIAETVVEILRDEGFDAVAVPSGVSAIELAKTWRPEIVLSDVIMPGLNGIDTGIKIREIVPSCKVILFSGQAATVDLLEQARQEGHGFEILAKPIRPERLIAVIRENSGPTS
jgi:CheY-like chemotaxis protein